MAARAMGTHTAEKTEVSGREAIVLRSEDAQIEATLVPGAGMVCCSLRHRGEELLGQRSGLDAYISEGKTMGIPLLYPWANRLSAERFALGDREVTLDRAAGLISRDPNGCPIHGLLAASPVWTLNDHGADDSHAYLRGRFSFGGEELLSAFPFPHELEMAVGLRDRTLGFRTTIHASGDPVPVSFGYHPYFTLPGLTRVDWEVELPVASHLIVDERMIPTGRREPAVGVEPGPLGERTFDDGYDAIAPGSRFALAGGGRRLELTFEQGYAVAVIYAPADDAVICFEPMTAPTNALVSGDGLRWVGPGEQFEARFSVAIS